jgi:RNA polymerase sigma factor (sigma-70 family)
MASGSSDRVFRQIHHLFNLGTVGMMTDAQLLNRFVSERDAAAEAAFEELMIRHGPMVFRVCRSVLRDTHDAEDAFQATFLVLAHRARSIRRHTSLASWLYGVAHRVASRAKSNDARRRARDVRVAVRTTESYSPAEDCHDRATLHEEVSRLPERLRAAVALCYLEGLTYEAAALQLQVSEATVRGRLAQARERLRRRMTARGVTIPAGLLVAGTAGQTQAAIPASLIHSTVRIALGFMVGNTAAVLARGVLNSMVLKQLKVVMVLVVLGIGSSVQVWHTFAAAIDSDEPINPKQVVGSTHPPAPAPLSAPVARLNPADGLYRLSGVVRVEGTGEPAAGAKLQIHAGDVFDLPVSVPTIVETGADGLFTVDLPNGPTQVRPREPPVGYYWRSRARGSLESIYVGPEERAIRREYRVSKGVVWNIEFTRGTDRRPLAGFVSWSDSGLMESFEEDADGTGRASVTLPVQRQVVRLWLRESAPFSNLVDTGSLTATLFWDTDFRPDELRGIEAADGALRGFRLIDANEKSATLRAESPIEPINDNGRLVIRVALPDRDSQDGRLPGSRLA